MNDRLLYDKHSDYKFVDQFSEKEQTGYVKDRKPQIVLRVETGEMFEASSPGYPDYSALFSRTVPNWFFREIVQTDKKWWEPWKANFKRTGRVWRLSRDNSREFERIRNPVTGVM